MVLFSFLEIFINVVKKDMKGLQVPSEHRLAKANFWSREAKLDLTRGEFPLAISKERSKNLWNNEGIEVTLCEGKG